MSIQMFIPFYVTSFNAAQSVWEELPNPDLELDILAINPALHLWDIDFLTSNIDEFQFCGTSNIFCIPWNLTSINMT